MQNDFNLQLKSEMSLQRLTKLPPGMQSELNLKELNLVIAENPKEEFKELKDFNEFCFVVKS